MLKSSRVFGASFSITSLTTFGLRILVNFLKDSEDPVVLAVALHDIGQYVKYCDRGKKCVDLALECSQLA